MAKARIKTRVMGLWFIGNDCKGQQFVREVKTVDEAVELVKQRSTGAVKWMSKPYRTNGSAFAIDAQHRTWYVFPHLGDTAVDPWSPTKSEGG